MPARATRGDLFAHGHLSALSRCRTYQYRRTFVPLTASRWNDLSDPVFDGVGLEGFKSRVNAFRCPNLLFISINYCLFFLPSMDWLCGVGSSDS